MVCVAAVACGRLLSERGRRRVLLGAAVYGSLGIVGNAVSPSVPERTIWTPMSALGAVLAVQAWREAAHLNHPLQGISEHHGTIRFYHQLAQQWQVVVT